VEKKRKKIKKKGNKKIHDNEKIETKKKKMILPLVKNAKLQDPPMFATCPHPSNSPMAPTRLAQRGKDFTMLPLGVKRLH